MSKLLLIISTLKQGGAERVFPILSCALKAEDKLTVLFDSKEVFYSVGGQVKYFRTLVFFINQKSY